MKTLMTRTFATGLTLLLLACAQPGVAETKAEPLSEFPRSTLTVQSSNGKHEFKVWLAQTNRRRTQGLMFVKELPKGSGMLFTYDEAQPISMWMKNTVIPLDMLFIAADGRITRIARDATPRSLATISSMGTVLGVLELAGGECKRLGIEVGDRVVHEAFGPM